MTIRIAAETPWYDLFSRGARDWLRHNQKVRSAVKESLPDLLAGSDLITRPNRTVAVPVKFLEHSRFRLLDPQNGQGAGQGKGQPGDVLRLVSSTSRPDDDTRQKISVVEKRLVDEYGYDNHSAREALNYVTTLLAQE